MIQIADRRVDIIRRGRVLGFMEVNVNDNGKLSRFCEGTPVTLSQCGCVAGANPVAVTNVNGRPK
jgi:hypothetical protein